MDWGQIVYSRIDTASNTEARNTWGITNKNYLYPSIASYSSDTIIEDAMIAFQRVGPNEYPQICVVNYNGGWSPSSTIVKDGDGLLDIRKDLVAPWDSLERWGDYSDIQRRYNQKACWLVGSYAVGNIANLSGHTNWLNAWIAEVGDVNVDIEENQINTIYIYPNPASSNSTININSALEIKEILITNIIGQSSPINVNNNQITLPFLNQGTYILTLKTKDYEIYHTKILIR